MQSEQNTVRNLINSHISYLKHIVKNASRRNSSKYWNRFVTTRFHEKNLATMTKARKTTMTTRSVQPEQTQRCGIWLIFIFLTSVVRFFFSWNWLVTKWLFHFDEFFDKTKLWARFQQETCRDALIALWQHVFTRKIILIFSALIGLRAPSKTNNLKG